MLLSNKCFTAGQYTSMIGVFGLPKEMTLKDWDDKRQELFDLDGQDTPWDYPLTEIDFVIENNIDVVLVQFVADDGYEYRFCEIDKDMLGGETND